MILVISDVAQKPFSVKSRFLGFMTGFMTGNNSG